MTRAIVYPHAVARRAERPDRAEGHDDVYARRGGGPEPVEQVNADDYLARLVKHVPVEALGICLFTTAMLAGHPFGWRLASLVVPLALAVYLDRRTRRRLPGAVRVRGLVYDAFVVIAFASWAIGTTDVARELVGLDSAESSFVVIVVAVVLTAADDWLGEHFGEGRKHEEVIAAPVRRTSQPRGRDSRRMHRPHDD